MGLPATAMAAADIAMHRDPGCGCCEKWAAQVRQHLFQHQQVQPRHPAEALQPGQEAAGRQRLALVIVQP